MHDVTWIGSRYFVSSAGYYDTYRSGTPRDAWPYDSNRDAGLAQVPSGGGYPTCRQWWTDAGNGLRARHCRHVGRSEEHTSELQSLMRISYAVFCLKKKTKTKQ